MKCIIQVDELGNPVNHPILISNFLYAFPDLDISGDIAPTGYAWFNRKNQQELLTDSIGIKQTVETSYTQASDGKGFEDVFQIRDKTPVELNELILKISKNKPYPSWILDQDTMQFWLPPVERPQGKYRWEESTSMWVEKQEGEIETPDKIPVGMPWPPMIPPTFPPSGE
jgi:hypothetical protein